MAWGDTFASVPMPQGPDARKTAGLKDIAAYEPALVRLEWASVAAVLREAQRRLEADGTRQSWMDGALSIATERAKG